MIPQGLRFPQGSTPANGGHTQLRGSPLPAPCAATGLPRAENIRGALEIAAATTPAALGRLRRCLRSAVPWCLIIAPAALAGLRARGWSMHAEREPAVWRLRRAGHRHLRRYGRIGRG